MKLSITNYNIKTDYCTKFVKSEYITGDRAVAPIKKNNLFTKFYNWISKLKSSKKEEPINNKNIAEKTPKPISLRELLNKIKDMQNIKDRENFINEWIKSRAEYEDSKNKNWLDLKLTG